ncbi:unnamed protein product [Rhodiola kirilowii]
MPVDKDDNVKKEEPRDQAGASSEDDDKPIGLKKPNPKLSAAKKTKKEAVGDPKRKPGSVKKEESGDASDDDFEDDKPIAVRRPNAKASASAKKAKKEEADDDIEQPVVKKKATTSKGATKEEHVKVVKKIVKKEKKVYDLPGQKRDPPEERDPLRIFYETLYQQVPTSEMAQIWMMESGLLPEDVAKKVFEKKQKKVQTLRSPAKTPSYTKTTTTTTIKSTTVKRELSSTTKITNSATVKKTPDTKSSLKPSKKRKTADASDADESDDDFEVISQPKKRKLAG